MTAARLVLEARFAMKNEKTKGMVGPCVMLAVLSGGAVAPGVGKGGSGPYNDSDNNGVDTPMGDDGDDGGSK